jgi:2-keto-3-deoxy-L-rhamnonate aldolase RhmA
MVASDGVAARLRRRREPMLGTVLTLPSVPLAELAAGPFDFVWIDLEHGALGAADVLPLAVAARSAGSGVFVRLPCADPSALAAVLDAGIDGIVAPHVESAAGARRLVSRLRYPPRGTRGFAARRGLGYGASGALPSTADDVLCVVQIESRAGLAAANQIAAIDGVDALVVGCADLALSLRGDLDLGSRAVREGIERVEQAAAGAGIAAGIAGPDDSRLLRDLAGHRSSLFVCSADVRIYARGVGDRAEALRRELIATRDGRGVRVGA